MVYLKLYPYAYAESDDGKWQAYLFSTTRDGYDLANGLCDGVIVYKGNKNGDIGKIHLTVHCDGKEYSYLDEAMPENRKRSRNLEYLIEKVLVRKEMFYWFTDGIQFQKYDLIQIEIRWESDGEQKTSKLDLIIE